VDGMRNVMDLHPLSITTDDTWADCEVPFQTSAGDSIKGMPIPYQGDGMSQRNGNSVVYKRLRVHGMLRWDVSNGVTAGSTLSSLVRIIIVHDTQHNNGDDINAEDVIGNGYDGNGTSMVSGNGNALRALTKPSGWGRYEIVYDQIFKCPPRNALFDGTDGAVNSVTLPFTITVVQNTKVRFNSNSNKTTEDVLNHSWHMIAACEASSPSVPVQIAAVARQSFVDP